jgi:hypothetical protein
MKFFDGALCGYFIVIQNDKHFFDKFLGLYFMLMCIIVLKIIMLFHRRKDHFITLFVCRTDFPNM